MNTLIDNVLSAQRAYELAQRECTAAKKVLELADGLSTKRCRELSLAAEEIVWKAVDQYNTAPVDDIIIRSIRISVSAHPDQPIFLYVHPTLVVFRGELIGTRVPDKITPEHTRDVSAVLQPIIQAKLNDRGLGALQVGEVSLATFYYYAPGDS